jgi:hypothetical protein
MYPFQCSESSEYKTLTGFEKHLRSKLQPNTHNKDFPQFWGEKEKRRKRPQIFRKFPICGGIYMVKICFFIGYFVSLTKTLKKEKYKHILLLPIHVHE